MIRIKLQFLALSLIFVSSLSWSIEVEPYADPEQSDAAGFQDFFTRVAPNVYVSGQPSEEGLSAMQAQGVTRVISLRTQQEMDNRKLVPFDEAAKLEAMGMEYVHIPLGGPDTPYTPAGLALFAEAVAEAEGSVLLHCTVGWRASHMWAAYLIAHHGFEVADAFSIGNKMNMRGFPAADLLDRKVSLEPAGGNQ